MKKLILDTEFDCSPEMMIKTTVDPEFLDYACTNMDDISQITVIEIRDISPSKTLYKLKYEVDPPLPGFIQKIVPKGSKGMVMALEIDRDKNLSTVDIIPEIMQDKFKGHGTASFMQKGDKWVQHMEIDMEVKIKVIGGKIEEFIVKQMETSMKKEFELMNLFIKEKRAE